ncbi:hypothetical protein GLOIN_2v1812804 [Rhizophagus irregularis DAOM 181602=DAOM 197198]|nr:hypothetical protein GLOIN_2v1812804 [Rhizophagus irregularis DAOM 181602=DAOM 197198]
MCFAYNLSFVAYNYSFLSFLLLKIAKPQLIDSIYPIGSLSIIQQILHHRMFAYIRKIKKLEKNSSVNLKFFDSFGPLQYVKVIGIDRNVRFFEVLLEKKKYYYIIDKYENW